MSEVQVLQGVLFEYIGTQYKEAPLSKIFEPRVTVIGAGAWGTALAHAARLSGTDVVLWGRSGQAPLEEAMTFSKDIILAVPVQTVREMAKTLEKYSPGTCLIASKGLEAGTGLLLSEVVNQEMPECIVGALGGPNLAKEVIQGWPCATTVACERDELLDKASKWFKNSPLTIQKSKDSIGVQVAGALKNVMAIGYGLLQQVSLGENIMATYLTKAAREIQKIIRAMGGQDDTILSYAGMGDLILTCCSPYSRNSQFGRLFPSQSQDLVEGKETLKGILVRCPEVDMPLVKGLRDILSGEQQLSFWPSFVTKA